VARLVSLGVVGSDGQAPPCVNRTPNYSVYQYDAAQTAPIPVVFRLQTRGDVLGLLPVPFTTVRLRLITQASYVTTSHDVTRKANWLGVVEVGMTVPPGWVQGDLVAVEGLDPKSALTFAMKLPRAQWVCG